MTPPRATGVSPTQTSMREGETSTPDEPTACRSPRVRVGPEHGGLHEGGVSDRLRDHPCVAVARGPLDLHERDGGDALGVTDQLRRERRADLLDGVGERRPCAVGRADRALAGRTAREQQHGVVRARATVHGERGEPRLQPIVREPGQVARRDRGVGRDEGEHRGEVRVDHAHPLGGAADPIRAGRCLRGLRHRVRRHDGVGERATAIGSERLPERGHRRQHLGQVHRLADHAGRARQHVVARDPRDPRRRLDDPPGIGRPTLARGGVRLTAVHHHSGAAARGDPLA